jgi:membrane protease YdiL (CAAX protease family)
MGEVVDEKHTAYAPRPEGARIPPLWLQPLVYLLVVGLVLAAMLLVAIGTQVIFAVAGHNLPPDIMQSWIAELALSIAFEVLAVAIVVFWISRVERRPLPSAGISRNVRLEDIMLLGLGGVWAFCLIAALAFSGVQAPPNPIHGLSAAALAQLPFVLIMVVLFAVAEEVVFRGWILSDLAVRVGPPGALALSSVLFAMVHVFPWELTDPSRVLSFLSYAAMGLALGAVALNVGQVWSASAMHAGFNAVIVFASLSTSETDARAVWMGLASPKRGLDDLVQAVIWLVVNGALAGMLAGWWWWQRKKLAAEEVVAA